MFKKALFKQSCKANWIMWLIVTIAVCFMLACVMLISGGRNTGELISGISDTIIISEMDTSLEKRGLNYYQIVDKGLNTFDATIKSGGTAQDAVNNLKNYIPDIDYSLSRKLTCWKLLEKICDLAISTNQSDKLLTPF